MYILNCITAKKGTKVFWAVGSVFLIAGLIFGSASFLLFPKGQRTEVAKAKIVRYEEKLAYYPVLQFKTGREGADIEFISKSRMDRSKHEIGETLDIRYDPNDPKDAVTFETEADQRITKIIFAILGAVLVALGGPIIVLMSISVFFIKRRSPENLEAFYFWVNFIGGVAGALVFALPSFLSLPVITWAYQCRPNFIFPDDKKLALTFLLGGVFTLLGLIIFVVGYFIGRAQLEERPRWRKESIPR